MIKPYERWDDDLHTLLWVCNTKEESSKVLAYAKKIAEYHSDAKISKRHESRGWIVEVTFLDL